MERAKTHSEKFEPELYCLRCQGMEWDEEARRCANFLGARCPLSIRGLLAGLEMNCLVL